MNKQPRLPCKLAESTRAWHLHLSITTHSRVDGTLTCVLILTSCLRVRQASTARYRLWMTHTSTVLVVRSCDRTCLQCAAHMPEAVMDGPCLLAVSARDSRKVCNLSSWTHQVLNLQNVRSTARSAVSASCRRSTVFVHNTHCGAKGDGASVYGTQRRARGPQRTRLGLANSRDRRHAETATYPCNIDAPTTVQQLIL